MRKVTKASAWVATIILVISCASTGGHKEKNIGYSLASIQTAVADNIPGGLNKVSQNRREFVSYFFLPTQFDETYKKPNVLYRARARAFVLGDRRPYDLVVQVEIGSKAATKKEIESAYSHEDLQKGRWTEVGQDNRLAKRFAIRIVDSLKKAQRNRNLIDDFRAF